jgi:adenylate cyclase
MSEHGDDLNAWLTNEGLEGAPQEELLEGYCQRLVGLGVPLMRLHVAQSAFHPRYGGLGFEWARDAGMSRERYGFTETPAEQWLRSPLYDLLSSGRMEVRERLSRDGPDSRYPLLNQLRADGATDYFAAGLILERRAPGLRIDPANPPEGVLISWTSDRPGGFSDADLNRVRSAQPYLGLALKSASNRQMARDLLQVYLGRDAGRRVMSGELQRGSLQQIDAVICNFDLTGFTVMAERLPGPDMIEMLNDYFALAVAEIQGAGGHVLKFMGDGLMAMFDHGDRRADADAALDAVVALRRRMDARNRDREAAGLPSTRATAALHAGEILYGNIGAENRLDFTVIGPAVNLTARLSGMHRAVGQEVILSEEVGRAATPGRHDLVSLGRYMMRGVATPRELFTIYDG